MTAQPGLASISLNVIWQESYCPTLTAHRGFIMGLWSNIISLAPCNLGLFIPVPHIIICMVCTYNVLFYWYFSFSLINPDFICHCFIFLRCLFFNSTTPQCIMFLFINLSISFGYILKYIDEEIAMAVDYPAKPNYDHSFIFLIN